MKLINFKNIVESIGMAAIVASLVFVGIQLQQELIIAESEILASNEALELEFAQLIQERPSTWRKGLAGEQLTADEEVEFDLIAYTLFRLHANAHRRSLVFEGITIGSGDNQVRQYAFFVYENPGLRAWFDQLIESRALIDRAYGLQIELQFYPKFVSEYIQQLEESQPEFPEKRFFPY